MHRVAEAVKDFIVGRVIGLKGTVAVSGGADSVALLRVFLEWNWPIQIAHVNHQLRGEESDGDEAFVAALAKNVNVPFLCHRAPIPAGVNVEAAARKARYDWFATLETDWIATAHTADDQVETVLHRILRGTGIQGLRGIQEMMEIPSPRVATRGLAVIRPFLPVRRAEILSYLKDLNQDYCTDSTNADTRFTRNRIRHELLPLLETFNPDIRNTLRQLARQADLSHRITDYYVREKLEDVELPRAGSTLIFDGLQFTERTHFPLRREILRHVWTREGWPAGDMTFEHWVRLGDLTEGDYPGGIRLERAGKVVRLGPRS